ncbi:LysR family transcriptional regulator [Oceanicella sp. SM1341]|uniref:LysR family transcriptional regulator n=1 Tax=Oceanicella sp. SM1341 TaxID=1548889 RepID=UPI000E4E827C|nr:LysR family transcriptional regulator [Oceanicella sp. SM1341]
MSFTLRQLHCFLAVAEAGSFSAAARQMNIAQPALSQAVKELEGALDMRLFDRTTRRVELTEAGAEFRGTAGKVVEDLDQAVRDMRDLAARRRGRVRIAAPPLLASAVLPRAMAEFRELHPGVTVELADLGTDQIVERVRSGQADCGLGTFPPSGQGVERVALMRDSLMVFAAAGTALAQGTGPVPWTALDGLPVITLTRESGIRLLVEIGFESARVALRPAFEVSQITTALSLVEARLGVAVLPTYALAALRDGMVVSRPMTGPAIDRDVTLIHPTGRSPSPAVAAFAGVLRRTVQRQFPGRGPAHATGRRPQEG